MTEKGKIVYERACKALDSIKFTYEKVEEESVILFGFQSDDMRHNLLIKVDEERSLIKVLLMMPFAVNKEKASDIAIAVCNANNRLVCGHFDYDMEEKITYEFTQIYTSNLISEETIGMMIVMTLTIVEEYDDKFMALNKGYLKPEDFKN